MQCPRCNHPDFVATGTCPRCGFHGDYDQIEELSRLEWLMGEMDTWVDAGILKNTPKRLQNYYKSRLQEVQTALGLYFFPFRGAEARQAWPELRQHELLFKEIERWLAHGFIKSGYLPAHYARLMELRERLTEYQGPEYPESDRERLEEINFLLDAIQQLEERGEFYSDEDRWNVSSPHWAEKAKLESILNPPLEIEPEADPVGLEDVPAPGEELAPLPTLGEDVATAAHLVPHPSFRERLWRTILSEQTLQALLFLGIFLLFVAAISFVVWGWKDFSAPVRVVIPSAFTALFVGLGWMVRTKTQLSRSALALSAIAALLIPIDFYTIYANYGSPPNGWPEFWLLTSLACLIVYIFAALQMQSRFFGYITGIAAGSMVLAFLEVATNISRDWYSAALSVLAVFLIILATRISNLVPSGRWNVFAEPFRYLALWTPAILMPLTLGLRLVTRDTYDVLHYTMALNWLLGGLIFGWGAIFHRSRSLGILSATALPVSVYMLQGAVFHQLGINPAWHAFGLACLTPLYLYVGHRLSTYKDDAVLMSHAQTATRWGMALIVVAALLSLTDLTSGTAAAASHAILVGSTVLIALLWERPRALYAASFFSFTASTFAMTELSLALNQLGVAWISLGIAQILLVLFLARRADQVKHRKAFFIPLVVSAYIVAGAAIFPPIFIYDGQLLAYALGNWIIMSAWGAYLAHLGQPGFIPIQPDDQPRFLARLLSTTAIYHWLITIPFPVWVWIVNRNQQFPDLALPLLFAGLAWFMVLVSHWLRFIASECRVPWHTIGLGVSVLAPTIAFANVPEGHVPAITLLAIGFLYFVDTLLSGDSTGFYPAGFVTAWGLWLLLKRAQMDNEIITFALCLLVAAYFLAGLNAERGRHGIATFRFLAPLYQTAHLLSIVILARIYVQPLNELFGGEEWTGAMQLWGAADQLLLAIIYGLFSWGRYQERWGHIAAWLAMLGGGFVAIGFSEGHGSLAAKGALIAAVMVLAERALHALKERRTIRIRSRAFLRLAWRLYRRPLLVAGWTASVGIIVLSLVRNLILLGGGRIQQTWAAAGLVIISALYALSARLFGKARFVWFSVIVLFLPWTLLTNLGWFTDYKSTLPDFAISWTVLGWLLFLLTLFMERRAPLAYIMPLKTAVHVLLPFSMLWAIANTEASLYTLGLSIVLYVVSAWLNHKEAKQSERKVSLLEATKFFYPALGLIPLWSVYWLDYLSPAARHEQFGLLLLAFGALGLLAGQRLERVAPHPTWRRAYGFPAYLTGYLSIIVGTMLVAHLPDGLALALLYDALLMVVSAWLFRSSLWLHPGTALTALSLLTAMQVANIPIERQGWWLIGLAGMYLLTAWILRRIGLIPHSSALIIMGFLLIALGLPPSSLDQIGAIWGYGAAALLYASSAFWLRQPILLIPACVLIIVPYAGLLQRSAIPPEFYGWSLFPGALFALYLGWSLDQRLGAWTGFPWNRPSLWLAELARRSLNWWALPLYTLGLSLATAAPLFTDAHPEIIALNFILLAAFYGWAVYRFRLRFWLLMALLSLHYGWAFYLETFQFWQNAEEAWLRFLPLTIIMMIAGLVIEKHLNEGTPLDEKKWFSGWSRPFYLFLIFDLFIAQVGSLGGTFAGMWISIIHVLLIAVLATIWMSTSASYLSLILGAVALFEWRAAENLAMTTLPIHLAGLALGYGVLGFGYTLLGRLTPQGEIASQPKTSAPGWLPIWEFPLQKSGMVISFLALGLAPTLGIDVIGWSVRALFGVSFREFVEVETISMLIWVLSLIGLLYAAASAVYRKLRLAYLAGAMLLAGWFLYAYYINIWDNLRSVQWYALPAGFYLLAIGFLEWERGNRDLARWLDYIAMLLLMGSLFWQTLVFGWLYASLLGIEGFAAFWWGSARRLRRFFYAGMAGVILATLGQLLNALQEVNQWITFGLIGLILVILAIIVERKLEAIKAWRLVLETWE